MPVLHLGRPNGLVRARADFTKRGVNN